MYLEVQGEFRIITVKPDFFNHLLLIADVKEQITYYLLSFLVFARRKRKSTTKIIRQVKVVKNVNYGGNYI